MNRRSFFGALAAALGIGAAALKRYQVARFYEMPRKNGKSLLIAELVSIQGPSLADIEYVEYCSWQKEEISRRFAVPHHSLMAEPARATRRW